MGWPLSEQPGRDADFLRGNMNLLAAKVGALQAKLVSIDGLGQRVAKVCLLYTSVRPGRTRMRNFDMPLAIAASTLLLLGLLMVYSASIALADGPRYASYGRYYFVIRHGLFVTAGLVAGAVVLAIPIRVWQRLALSLIHIFSSPASRHLARNARQPLASGLGKTMQRHC